MTFKRILLKISGEALGGADGTGIDPPTLKALCSSIASVAKSGCEIAVVMGAGNFYRGLKGAAEGMDRVTGDHMGMIATMINALALREGLRSSGVKAIAMSAIPAGTVVKPYNSGMGRKMLSKGKVILCAGGTGNPFFTTDTAAVLRAMELECDAMLKATMVDGIYDKDPKKYPDAARFDEITYNDVLDRKLGIMDLTAVTLARDNGLPMVVFNMEEQGVIENIIKGDLSRSTLVRV